MSAAEVFPLLVQVLGWCLVHFLWQGALVGALYALVRAVLPRGNARYVLAMLALLTLAACPVVTAWYELQVFAQPVELGSVVVRAAGVTASQGAAAPQAGLLALLRVTLPWLVLAWTGGVVLLGARLLHQWHGLRAIVRSAEASPLWQARAQQFAKRLGLKRVVRILASVRIATPTLVGWLRPVVVLPTAMLAQMPAEQVDLILAHELAHLRRLDHFANLFQVVLETLFFYHPVVHWISRDARNERELCCDALALHAAGGRPRDFVAALAGLEEFRMGQADLALAASGGVLVERAWFITGVAPRRRHPRFGMAVVLALATLCVALGVTWHQAALQRRIEAVIAANATVLNRHLGLFTARTTLPRFAGVPLQHQDLPPVLPAAVRDPVLPAAVSTRVHVGLPGVRVPKLDMTPPIAAVVPLALPSNAALEHKGEAVQGATMPRVLAVVPPTYPQQALASGIQGSVMVGFTLDAAGVPRDPHIVASSSRQFDAAALAAIVQWRFAEPATPGRQYRQTFTFRPDKTTQNGPETRDCFRTTGSRICRQVYEPNPALHVIR